MRPNKFGRLSFHVSDELLIILTLHIQSAIVVLQPFALNSCIQTNVLFQCRDYILFIFDTMGSTASGA